VILCIANFAYVCNPRPCLAFYLGWMLGLDVFWFQPRQVRLQARPGRRWGTRHLAWPRFHPRQVSVLPCHAPRRLASRFLLCDDSCTQESLSSSRQCPSWYSSWFRLYQCAKGGRSKSPSTLQRDVLYQSRVIGSTRHAHDCFYSRD